MVDTTRVYTTNEDMLAEKLAEMFSGADEIIIKPGAGDLKRFSMWFNAREDKPWKWQRKPDAIVVEGNTIHIIEAKNSSEGRGGSVEEKLVNTAWRDVYWPKVFANTDYEMGDYIFMFTGHEEKHGVLELMDALGLTYYHMD